MRLYLLTVLLVTIGLQCQSQQLPTQNFSSAGGEISTTGSQRLISIIGQPIAYNSNIMTETKAGFLQVAGELITDNESPIIQYTGANQILTQGNTNTLTATVTDNLSVSSVRLYYKAITKPQSDFQFVQINATTSNNYQAAVQPAWHDQMGLEYYFVASDGANNTIRNPASGSYYAYLKIPTVQLPASVLSAGTRMENYRIIALPYSSEGGDAITNIFGTESGLPAHTSDKTKWRLATYNPAQTRFDEYPDNLAVFKRGQGYWFLMRNSVLISLGEQTAPVNSRNDLFTLTLKPGWNMVGNPYPVAIDWDDVQNFSGNPEVSDLNLYAGGFSLENNLPPFQGGFVNNTGTTDLAVSIPFAGQTTNGRLGERFNPGSDVSSPEWLINLAIYQNDTYNKLGRFGMTTRQHEVDAKAFNPPAWSQAPEINFNDPTLKQCREVVTSTRQYQWHFIALGIAGENTLLQWDENLGRGSEPLYLVDEQTATVIDMRAQSSYHFTMAKDHRFSIFFGKETITTDELVISSPYPNPALEKKVTFHVGLPNTSHSFQTSFLIYDSKGQILTTQHQQWSAGIHTVEWHAGDQVSGGVYYYRIMVQSSSEYKIATGKIIVP